MSTRERELAERVRLFNRITRWARGLVPELDDPVLGVQLVPVSSVRPNGYNPNAVAGPEMELLRASIEADGVTMPLVVQRDERGFEIVDGFHRHVVLSERGREYIPCSVIDSDPEDRMASTIRHNRARGKHQVELMAAIVRTLLSGGWGDERIGDALGMSEEEVLRLRQTAGVAEALKAAQYTRAWEGRDGEADLPG